MAVLPSPPPIELLALAIVCFLAGGVVPFWYFVERMQGFGRAVLKSVPYEPPAGQNRDEALQRASEVGQEGVDGQADSESET